MPGAVRHRAYGQEREPTFVDRFGVWLSARQVHRHISDFKGKRIADLGCGYEAKFVRSVLGDIDRAVIIDVALAPDLRRHPKVLPIEGQLPEVLREVERQTFDVVLCLSVLEHLWEPVTVLTQMHRMLAPGGICLINVPSWRGKRFLEFSAYRLGLSPTEEMNDHKNYYDPRDLWPHLVRAGFSPGNIRCFRHKFGLNTFAVCRVDRAAT